MLGNRKEKALKKLRELSEGKFVPSESPLYNILKSLRKLSFVISIPPWSDSNGKQIILDETIYDREFQSHHGLILTILEEQAIYQGCLNFQSHHGLILTPIVTDQDEPFRPSFNPTMV